MPDSHTAYLGLGGNIGDVQASLSAALRALDVHESCSVSRVSGLYKTPPWGIEEQDWFLNLCAEVKTTLFPRQLLNACLKIETQLKRERNLRWGPRTVDLDVLIFEDLEVHEEDLSIPHPRMQERLFVLKPLSDIAPDIKINDKPIAQCIIDLDEPELELVPLKEAWWRE